MNRFKHAKWWRSYLDKLKQAFSYTKASQQKEKSKEKQREAKRSKEENRGQQLQSSLALLEHLPKSIFYMLYTISKLRKSRIQRFKSCVIWSWNEEVTSFGRWLLQAEGRIQQSVAKSPFCCGMISQPCCTVLWISPEVSCCDGSQTPQYESQLRRGVESAFCCKEISQTSLCTCEISQTSFFTCEMVPGAPRYLRPTLWDIFLQIFLYKFPFFSL